MRILHVSAYYAPAFRYGGPPRTIHGLCRALCAHGADVEVFTTDADGTAALPVEITRRGEHDGVPVQYFPCTWPRSPIGSRPLAKALRGALPHADVLHIHGLWNRVVWAAARAARRAGVPYVLSPRGMLEPAALAHHRLRKRVAWSLVERSTVDGAALLHATSEVEAGTLRALDPRAEVIVVPNGVDLPPATPRTATEPVIVFLGRLHPIKRLDLLVDAFARVRASGRRAELVIAGPDEAGLRAALEARVPEVAGSIAWPGAVAEGAKHELLARAAALVLCSDSESFGLSAAEAMAAAVPVVVTRTCPWAEVEQHGAGFWVEPRADAIAAALMRLLDYPAAARAMGARGQDLIERRYRWDVVAAQMEQHYDRLVAAPRKHVA